MDRFVALVALSLRTLVAPRLWTLRVGLSLSFGLNLVGADAVPAWMLGLWFLFVAATAARIGAVGTLTLPTLPVTPVERGVAVVIALVLLDVGPMLLPSLAWYGPARLFAGQIPLGPYLLFALTTAAGVLFGGLVPWKRLERRSATRVGPLHDAALPPRAAVRAFLAGHGLRQLAIVGALGLVTYAALRIAGLRVGFYVPPSRDLAYLRPLLNELAAPSPLGWVVLGGVQVFAAAVVPGRIGAVGVPLGHTLRALPVEAADVVTAVAREAFRRSALLGLLVYVPAAAILFATGAWRHPLEALSSTIGLFAWSVAGAGVVTSLLGVPPDARLAGPLAAGLLLAFCVVVILPLTITPAPDHDPLVSAACAAAFTLLVAANLARAYRGAVRRLGPA